MKIKSFLYILIIIPTFQSCIIEEMKNVEQKAIRLRTLIATCTDCHEVSIINYNTTNGITKEVNYKLVGCEYNTIKEESSKIIKILKDSVPNFCEIRSFNLVFVSKQENQTVQYWKCQPRTW